MAITAGNTLCEFCNPKGNCELPLRMAGQMPRLKSNFAGNGDLPAVEIRETGIACLPFAMAPDEERRAPFQKRMCESYEAS